MSYFGVELSIVGGRGGDFAVTNEGQPIFDVDTFDDDPALRGSLIRMLSQVPRIIVNGDYLGQPDDPYHPDDGVGLPMLVDQLWTSGLQDEITTQILDGLATFDSVLDKPPPTVALSMPAPNKASIVVTYTRITGQTRTLPPIELSATGG